MVGNVKTNEKRWETTGTNEWKIAALINKGSGGEIKVKEWTGNDGQNDENNGEEEHVIATSMPPNFKK